MVDTIKKVFQQKKTFKPRCSHYIQSEMDLEYLNNFQLS